MSRCFTSLLPAAVSLALFGFGCMSPPKLAPLSIPAKGSVSSIEVTIPQGLTHTITDPALIGQIIDELNHMNGPMYAPLVTETVPSAWLEFYDGDMAGKPFAVAIRPNSISGFGPEKQGMRDVPIEQMVRFFALIRISYPK